MVLRDRAKQADFLFPFRSGGKVGPRSRGISLALTATLALYTMSQVWDIMVGPDLKELLHEEV